jgi:hypothetical protein
VALISSSAWILCRALAVAPNSTALAASMPSRAKATFVGDAGKEGAAVCGHAQMLSSSRCQPPQVVSELGNYYAALAQIDGSVPFAHFRQIATALGKK